MGFWLTKVLFYLILDHTRHLSYLDVVEICILICKFKKNTFEKQTNKQTPLLAKVIDSVFSLM